MTFNDISTSINRLLIEKEELINYKDGIVNVDISDEFLLEINSIRLNSEIIHVGQKYHTEIYTKTHNKIPVGIGLQNSSMTDYYSTQQDIKTHNLDIKSDNKKHMEYQ